MPLHESRTPSEQRCPRPSPTTVRATSAAAVHDIFCLVGAPRRLWPLRPEPAMARSWLNRRPPSAPLLTPRARVPRSRANRDIGPQPPLGRFVAALYAGAQRARMRARDFCPERQRHVYIQQRAARAAFQQLPLLGADAGGRCFESAAASPSLLSLSCLPLSFALSLPLSLYPSPSLSLSPSASVSAFSISLARGIGAEAPAPQPS